MHNALEFDTLAANIKKEIWHEILTLGDLFKETKDA